MIEARARPIRRRPPRSWWAPLLVALALLGLSSVARAETWGQYLVVIDDSGSMNQSDPDRLVMLASLALTAGLSDADQIMVVGLNELASGEVSGPRFVAPGELLDARDGGEGERALSGAAIEKLAAHGGSTPCKRALDQAATLLEAVAAAGAPQTLLMLTDGACTGGLDPAETWLGRLRSHAEDRFRFALLSKRQSDERLDPTLIEYASATGWTADPSVSFDSRSLLRAFAEVLSFSRGLRYDGGGRVGLERSFAGARELRILAVSTEGRAPISLARTDASMDSRQDPITGGPTFKHPSYGWSLRVAKTGPQALPFAVRSPDAGVEVLVIPSYGALRVEAVVGPCPSEASNDQVPPLPWTRERAVRSGQPACAWARLVGDTGETIDPNTSFAFHIELCEDEACAAATAMQPGQDGIFNAQLGVMAQGRSDRWFRAHGGSLAAPLTARRGIQAVAFGITSVASADAPDEPLAKIELGVLPKPVADVISLEFSGSFPEGSEATVRCEITGDAGETDLLAGELPCLRCVPTPASVALQDPFTVQVEIETSSLCPQLSAGLISAGASELPVALDLIVEATPDSAPDAAKIAPRRVPLRATLRHAPVVDQRATVTGGARAEGLTLSFPRPVNGSVELALTPVDEAAVPEGLTASLAETELRLSGAPGETASVGLSLSASDCCTTGSFTYELSVRDPSGGPGLVVPVIIDVHEPSFWVCPGKIIAKVGLGVAAIGLLIWLIHGLVSPPSFADGAVLARAESHEALAKLSDGDPDWRLVRSLEPTKRSFRTPATVHLGGPQAALPSLRELPADARIEARGHGNATLVVEAEGIESFKESTGWAPVPVGDQPIGSSIVLRRDDTYLMFRR